MYIKVKTTLAKLGNVIMYFRFLLQILDSSDFCAHERHLVRFFNFFRIQEESKSTMLKICNHHQGSLTISHGRKNQLRYTNRLDIRSFYNSTRYRCSCQCQYWIFSPFHLQILIFNTILLCIFTWIFQANSFCLSIF